jgi:DNA-directed RNA polymerase sigma subunit (sigma70/sigma32)
MVRGAIIDHRKNQQNNMKFYKISSEHLKEYLDIFNQDPEISLSLLRSRNCDIKYGERNILMFCEYLTTNKSLLDVAKENNITSERVRQIVCKYGRILRGLYLYSNNIK